jgi:hypothetical protein
VRWSRAQAKSLRNKFRECLLPEVFRNAVQASNLTDFLVYRIGVLQRQALQIGMFLNQRFTKIDFHKPLVYHFM